MFTLNNILSVARSAITAQQAAVQVASNNIANASTEGYSRQRVVMRPNQPIQTPLGPAATGVRVAAYERMRDPLLDVSFRRDEGKAAAGGMRRDLMRQIEGVYGEPSENGLGATLDAFWNAWDDLANDPLSDSARGMVRQRATQLTSGINRAAAELENVGEGIRSRLRDSVSQLNDLGAQVAKLNVEIVAAEAGGGHANDLRDSRDRLIDRMAGLAHVRVTEQPDGSASVVVENTLFVDAGESKQLALGATGSALRIEVAGSGTPVSTVSEGSALHEALRVYNTDLPAARERLDEFAAALVGEVNRVHQGGFRPADGTDGHDFFHVDPAGVTASTLTLHVDIQASLGNIAASGVAGQSTDNSVALALADLRNLTSAVATPSGGTTTFGGAYRDMISSIAQQTRTAEENATVFATLAAQTDTRRASVSGVSIDEELMSLMQHQQAYVAATRVVNAVDEMLRDLLAMGR